jgi:hypothetical protein
MKHGPVVLVIRDPDYENEFVTQGDVEIIDVDLGSEFNGPNGFDPDNDRAWVDDQLEKVAQLPEDSPVRQRVQELVDSLLERGND